MKTKCQNPFCPKCHPDAFHKLQMDLNTLNAIGGGLAGVRGHNPLLGVQQDFTLLFDYINTDCHD